MSRLVTFVTLLTLLLAGCDQEAMLEKFVPKEEAALARELVAKIAARDFAAVEARLDSKLKLTDLHANLEAMSDLLPDTEPKAVRTIGAHTVASSSATTYNLTFEYEYPETWIVANVMLERRNEQLTLQSIYFTPYEQSLTTLNRFTFSGKGIAHYVVLVLVVAVPLFVIYALVACARTRIPKRKWLWLLFIAVGFVQLEFNWTTGAWDLAPLSFLLLGAGFFKAGPAAPYIFSLAVPVGAGVFLARRRSLRQASETQAVG